MDLLASKTIVLNEGDPADRRAEILAYFRATWELDDKLYELLASDGAFYLRPEPLRHPLVFYFGHTASFYVNKLIIAKLIDQRIRAEFESAFAIGVDEMSWDDLNDANYNWPAIDDVRAYRKRVRELVEGLIESLPLTMPIDWKSPFWIIMMGIEHQRIHIETSSVILRRMPLEHIKPDPFWRLCPLRDSPAPENELLPVKGGTVTLGKARDHALYGWDNEYGCLKADVADFRASRHLVSNGAFLAFVEAGGYREPKWWTEEGREWLNFSEARHPLFWREEAGGYRYRALSEEIDLPLSWPVDVNYLEAKAFCNWKAAQTGTPIRLPSEEEWQCLRQQHEIPDQPYWKTAPGNINLEHWASACPVDHFAFGDFFDLIGNVWQWTETPISGFPGFEIHPAYDDFSTPTFDGRHNLFMGGSWISTGNEATRHARYAFRRHFFQHAGFRYVESAGEVKTRNDFYETDGQIAQYCEAHYGKDYYGVPNYARACADLCAEFMGGRTRGRALDLGCAVGRSTFELARHFAFVTGIDFSARFIRAAIELQETGRLRYVLPEEGELVSFHEKSLKELGLEGTAEKVEFWQGDAHNIKPQFTGYDLIFAGNLIDRLYDPALFLEQIHERLNPGGLLILSSPYTWLEEFTPREKWIGGFRKDGEPFSTLDGLKQHLSRFNLLSAERELPFVIRETRRKFQHSLAAVTVWERQEGVRR